MAPTTATVEMDHKGRVTIPEPVRKKLGINDLEQGEKELIEVNVRT